MIIFLFSGCSWSKNTSLKVKQNKNTSFVDCEKSKFKFACYLDLAMSKKDINYCFKTNKPLNCLKSYEEITGTKINCDSLDTVQFLNLCRTQFEGD